MTTPAPTSTTRWASPVLVSDWGGHHNCGSAHREAYDPQTGEPLADKRSETTRSSHRATYIGELVDTMTGEVVRQHLCSNAAAAFAHRWLLPFPVISATTPA